MQIEKILEFLKGLQANNHKAWMDEHRDQYHEAKSILENLIQYLIREVGRFDPDIATLEVKQCTFRINRDIRFSKDKTLYKTNMGAALQKEGKKSKYATYYLHLQPHHESFLGGGIYKPPNELLAKVRQEIDYNAGELINILKDEKFKAYYGELQGEKLKTAPKGYTTDHPNIELLRLKSYVVFHSFRDEEVAAAGFKEKIVEGFQQLKPFIDYMNLALDG